MAYSQEQTGNLLGLGNALISGLKGYNQGKKEVKAEATAAELQQQNREEFRMRQKTQKAEYERKFGISAQNTYEAETKQKMLEADQKIKKMETQNFMNDLSNGVHNYVKSGGNADAIKSVLKKNPEFFNSLVEPGRDIVDITNSNYNATGDDEKEQARIAVQTLQTEDPEAAKALDSDPNTPGIQIDPETFNKRFLAFRDSEGKVTYHDMLRLLQRNADFTKFMSKEEQDKLAGILKVEQSKAGIAEAQTKVKKASTEATAFDTYEAQKKLSPEERDQDKYMSAMAIANPKEYAAKMANEAAAEKQYTTQKTKELKETQEGKEFEALYNKKDRTKVDDLKMEGLAKKIGVDPVDFKHDLAVDKLYAENYLKIPPPKNAEVNKMLSDIKKKNDLSTEQKKVIREKSGLFQLASIASGRDESELKPEDKLNLSTNTGIMDSFLYGFTRKMSSTGNNKNGIEARQAFQQYNGVIRKLLSGVAVNPEEMKKVADAYGSPTDAMPVLLASLKDSLKQQVAEINTLYNDNPLVTHSIIGDDMYKLKQTIDKINKSINEMSKDGREYKPISMEELIPSVKNADAASDTPKEPAQEAPKQAKPVERKAIVNDLLAD